MQAQQKQIPAWKQKLAAIDTAGWTIPQRVDYTIVWAELNGLDFDHRVLRPWEKNPAFYAMVFGSQSDQPAREGPHVEGAIEVWQYQFPLSTAAAAELTARIRNIPAVYTQAKQNLTGNTKDLWTGSVREYDGQISELDRLSKRLAGKNPALDSAVQAAKTATTEFRAWIQRTAQSKTGPSGIGIENYNWYLKNVLLLPYSWQDHVTMMRQELARSMAGLALEQQHNRKLPPLEPVSSQEELQKKFNDAVTEYIAFLRDHDIVTVKDFFEPALRAQAGRFNPGPREFFNEVSYRDPIVMLTHDYHWIDLAWAVKDPHPDPIRRDPLLYNIFDTRTEGWATAMEEFMSDAGFLDKHPRGRELIYVLIAERAARALGDLMMHANQFTYEQAAKFAVANTPRGWLRENGNTVWGEQFLYLQQPAYGTSYLIGKHDLGRIIGELAARQGDSFTMKTFMDQMNAIGMIPATLVRWEMTGDGSEIARITRQQ
jgi:uncharacterized protein (DUF885 family)